ncbi:hypothetical protein [Photobacterium atrarenae]|uniref:Uncharacterized protein n=1 Tax=Photobacterium atrarenae TaxID=865757 RepID=A0ABY5GGL6_9GAMM|nr:hypothetical protein [Photobacterium atrarenae]UTV27971.1 hypothetical protein NNL38_01175 [Photobacterium atrarenae]
MDIERFAPNTSTTPPAVLQALPATIEMTGFSDPRHYLEQQPPLDPESRHQDQESDWVPPLDNQHEPLPTLLT